MHGPGFARPRRLLGNSLPKSMLAKPMPLDSGESGGLSLRSKMYLIKRPTLMLCSQSRTRLPVRLETTVLKQITENACEMQKNQPCSNVIHQKREREFASGGTLTLSWLPWWTATTPSPATTTRSSLWKHASRLSLSRRQLKTKINFLRNCG